MSPPALRVHPTRIYASAAGLLIPAFLFALFLSLAPQVHLRVHFDANDKSHECAATLFASASCLQVDGDLVRADARPLLPTQAAAPTRLSIFTAPVKMSILEHAPPAHS
jgi:hypothetical protein